MDDLEEEILLRVLSPPDFAAADAVMEKIGMTARDPTAARLHFAQSHWRLGPSRFLLWYGLRPPETCCEVLELETHAQRKSQRELDAHVRGHVDQLDSCRLTEYQQEIDRQCEAYVALLVRLNSPSVKGIVDSNPTIEDELDLLYAKLWKAPGYYAEEWIHLTRFLIQVRREKNAGNIELCESRHACALAMFEQFRRLLRDGWANCRRDSKRISGSRPHAPVSPIAIFHELYQPMLPMPRDLMLALEDEMALAHVVLRERRSTAASSVEITTPLVVLRGTVNAVKADAMTEQSVPEAAEAATLLKVERWSDLAIGITKDWQYVALTPAPAIGERFGHSNARTLRLPGKQWRKILTLLADSQDGRTTTRFEVIRALDLLSPPGQVQNDGRTRPGAIEAEITAEVHAAAHNALERLHPALGNLRYKLRRLVDGPKDRHQNFLRVEGDHVDSVFVVAYLVSGEHGALLFGPPRS